MSQRYLAVLEGSVDNFSAFVPDILGAVGAGVTPEQALESVALGLAFQLEDLRERGIVAPIPATRENLDVSDFEPEEPFQIFEVEAAPWEKWPEPTYEEFDYGDEPK
jgi:predicted RNase H-like HicB family nuclease